MQATHDGVLDLNATVKLEKEEFGLRVVDDELDGAAGEKPVIRLRCAFASPRKPLTLLSGMR